MRCLRGVVAAAALSASAVPAAADWQYTSWGMSPDQVRAASDEPVRENLDRALDAAGLRAMLTSPYRGGAMPFTATFLFDTEDRLRTVILRPVDRAACPPTLQALGDHYGPPRARADLGGASTLRWDDAGGDNLVVYSELNGRDCSVQYSPLPPTSPDGKGL